MASFVFLHGLCTYADDELHLGPVRLGRLDRHVVHFFAEHKTPLLSINGIGFGSPEEQAETALPQINSTLNCPQHLILLGNSMGGIVARVLQPLLEEAGHTVEVVTWGTPHLGTLAASRNDSLPLRLATKLIGYDLEKRYSTFKHYTPQAMATFNCRYPFRTATHFSLECNAPFRYTLPLLLPLHPGQPSDGFITIESQRFGQTIACFQLDHFAAIGYAGLHPLKSVRERLRQEFVRLMETILQLPLAAPK